MIEPNFMAALRAKTTRYDSELPCKRHGVVQRYTKNKGCVVCCNDKSRVQYMSTRYDLKAHTVRVHDDDWAFVEEVVKQLNDARKLKK